MDNYRGIYDVSEDFMSSSHVGVDVSDSKILGGIFGCKKSAKPIESQVVTLGCVVADVICRGSV